MKTKVIVGTVMVLVLFSSLNIMPAFAQLPSGAVSHWTFDEGSGTTAYDSVDTNHGTLIDEDSGNADGNTPPVWMPGKVGGALYFDGIDDIVNCGSNFGSISTAQALTVEAWINTTSTADGRSIVAQTRYGEGPWAFHTSPGGVYAGIHLRDSGMSSLYGSKYVVNDGKWHHVVGTWDGSTRKIRLYVDGKIDSEWTTPTFTMRSTDFPLTIGSNSPGIDRYWFYGLIDEVVVYNRALSFEEIQQRYIENGGNVVLATLGRYWIYDEGDINVDSVSGVRTGYLRSRYDITKEGEVDITDATIELETPITPENFQTENIQPPCTPLFDGVNYTYTWDFGDLLGGQNAMVSLPTYFDADFDIGFEGQRIWDSWITSDVVNQTLTIEFTAGIIDFHNVHVSVQIPKTDEVAPTIDPASISASPGPETEPFEWHMWSDETAENIEVNWGGNPGTGITYTFSVEVTVENKLFPEPIFYKPSVGFGANFDGSWSPPDSPHPQIDDDIDRVGGAESSVTYYGTGAFTWKEYVQSEHAISLPWCSVGFSEIYTKWVGEASVKSKGDSISGPATLRINKEPNTVKLSVDEHDLWWEVIKYRSCGSAIRLICMPTSAGGGGGEPGSAPMTVTIWSFEDGGLVTTSGCVRFIGENTEIEIH